MLILGIETPRGAGGRSTSGRSARPSNSRATRTPEETSAAGAGPVTGNWMAGFHDDQLTAIVIVEPDWVLSLTSPFESTCCVPVQFPCEVQLSETTFVMFTPVAGVETCNEALELKFTGVGESDFHDGIDVLLGDDSRRDDARPTLNLTLHLIRRLLRETGARLGEPMVEPTMSGIGD